MNLNFLQNFFTSVFNSVMSFLGVGVNLRPHFISVSFALLPIALSVSILSFGLFASAAAKISGSDFGSWTKKSYFSVNFVPFLFFLHYDCL